MRVVQWSPKTQWPEAREVPIRGFRCVRVGEASNPSPASKRRRTQRLRALQRSMDSDSEDDMPLVSMGPEVFAMSSDIGDTVVDELTPQDVLDALEQDLCQIEADQPIATMICWNQHPSKIHPTLKAFTINLRGGG